MGGFGSGRRRSCERSNIERCICLDVNRLHREGCLQAGWSGGWEWYAEAEKFASIAISTEGQSIVLRYSYRLAEDQCQSVNETVQISKAACGFGGTRSYFLCPGGTNGIECGRRVAKLHLHQGVFRCRHCHSLDYPSRGEEPSNRALRRARKIRRRLGGSGNLASAFPLRPRGMWTRTYESMRAEALSQERLADEIIVASMGRFLARKQSL